MLDRGIEFLPDRATLKQRQEAGEGLTRAELAVVLSYGKMDVYQELLASNLPDIPYLLREIEEYFPAVLVKRFRKQIGEHRLKREIIATQVTNDMVGLMGPAFHLRMHKLTGAPVPDITRGYLVARDVFRLDQRQAWIREMDNRVPTTLQYKLLRDIAYNAEAATVWLTRNRPGVPDIAALVKRFREGLVALDGALAELPKGVAPAYDEAMRKSVTDAGLARPAARSLLSIRAEPRALDIIDIANECRQPIPLVAEIYWRSGLRLRLGWVRDTVDALPATNDWNQRARFSLGETLRNAHAALVNQIIAASRGLLRPSGRIETWVEQRKQPLEHVEDMLSRLQQESRPDFAMLSVLVSELSRL